LTPAAATRISTSPAAGRGTGRDTGRNTSGPPGAAISMAVMLSGKESAMVSLVPSGWIFVSCASWSGLHM
jgi:hypothetical protein